MRRRCQITDLIASLRTVEGMWVECRRMTLGGLRPVQASYLPLYERTHQFRAYSSWLIPGMLQTREYATAVFGTIQARDDLIDDVTAATNTRIDRQQLMYDGDHRFAYLLEEFVLHCDIGGSDIMAAQLGHLLTVGTVPNVSLGVIPTNTTRSRWPVESFLIFDNTLVDVELISGQLNVTQPREINLYTRMFTELTELAVYGPAARGRIAAAINTLA